MKVNELIFHLISLKEFEVVFNHEGISYKAIGSHKPGIAIATSGDRPFSPEEISEILDSELPDEVKNKVKEGLNFIYMHKKAQ